MAEYGTEELQGMPKKGTWDMCSDTMSGQE